MSFTPEIVKGDPLYDLIVRLVKKHLPEKIIEIGSADGRGSTQAFIEGLGESVENVEMICIEAHPGRYKELCENVKDYSFINSGLKKKDGGIETI